jgi:hypothetical protein
LAFVDADDEPIVGYDSVVYWPEQDLQAYISWGLFVSAGRPVSLVCHECPEQSIEDVVYTVDEETGQTQGYLPCYFAGPVRVPDERLQQWRVDLPQLMRMAFAHMDRGGQLEEQIRKRVWRMGKAKWAGTWWTVFFARRLFGRDALKVIREAGFTSRSVVFVPTVTPDPDVRGDIPSPFIPLSLVLSWGPDGLRFDHDYVASQLEAIVAGSSKERTTARRPKRATRAAAIEALTREMEAHLRAARDHAYSTRDLTGTPTLLPRPTMDDLAKRLSVNRSTVKRCLDDETAYSLQYLWDLAADLDRIMAKGRSGASCCS